MPQLTSVSLIIPAYNDETTVGRLIDDADKLLSQVTADYEIVVVNDGSKDQTLARLQEKAATNPHVKLRNHEVNRGFGETIRELYYAGGKDLIFSLPGDYQYAPKELLTMAQGLDNYDFVIGLRVKRNDPPRRKFQSNIYNAMLRTLYGNRHKDVNSIKLFRRKILEKVDLRSKTAFVDAELVIRTEKAGFKVVEIPIEHLPRLSQGASGGKISVILETFKEMFQMRSTF
ncbi:MAG TPA: glycosyltransferase family 2 protein [Chroococcales cyanobacterium]